MLIFSDTDENDKITYNFISDWGLDTFSIDPTSGIITLSGSSLDHESIEHYILTVSASGIITVFFINILELKIFFRQMKIFFFYARFWKSCIDCNIHSLHKC